MKGRVSSYNHGKGFGFITPDDGSKDVFVHQSAIKIGTTRSLAVGQSVEFEVKVGNDGRAMAANVTEPRKVSVQSNNCGNGGQGRDCGRGGGGGEEEVFSDKGSGGRGRGHSLGRRGGGSGRGGEGCYGGDGEEAFSDKEGTDGKLPADIEILIRNCAAMEGAFGREIAKQIYVKQEKGNPRVNFLLPGDKYHAYYQQCVSEVSASIKNDRKLKKLESKAGGSSSMAAIYRKMNILHEHQVDSKAVNVEMRK